MAVGRKVNIDKLDLDQAGLRHDRGGQGGCSLRSHQPQGLCRRRRGGRAAIHPCRGLSRRGGHPVDAVRPAVQAAHAHIPWATYTDPELAQVGLTEAQAQEKSRRHAGSRALSLPDNDRAIAERKTNGLIKVMVVKGRPVGASIVGLRRAS